MTSKIFNSVVHPHHVIRVTELLEESLIQYLLFTHHCYSLPCVGYTFRHLPRLSRRNMGIG